MDRFFRPRTLNELSEQHDQIPINPVDSLLSSQDASKYAPDSSQDVPASQQSEDTDADTEQTTTIHELSSNDAQYVGAILDINWDAIRDCQESVAAKTGSLGYPITHERQQGGHGKISPV